MFAMNKSVIMLRKLLSAAFFLCLFSFVHGQELSIHPGFWKIKYYEDSNEISKKEFDRKMKTVPAANEAWEKSKSQYLVASIAGAVGGFGIGYWITTDSENKTPWIAMAVGGTLLSAILTGTSAKNRKDALLTYNSQFDSGGIRVTPSSSGVGLAIHF